MAEPAHLTPLAERYRQVRAATEALAEGLSDEDCALQSMPEASPVKWHLAHTTWFFETFVLLDGLAPSGYRAFDDAFRVLFNSYYQGVGERHPRAERGLISRPSRGEVMRYRRQVDEAVLATLAHAPSGGDGDPLAQTLRTRLELGLQHEQQHQELLLTDLKHLLSCNPARPAYRQATRPKRPAVPGGEPWRFHPGGLCSVGRPAEGAGFVFDNETPQHRVWLEPFEIATEPVTQAQWMAFIADGGYRRPELWLSDGWDEVQRSGWEAPGYWQPAQPGRPAASCTELSAWRVFTLHGDIEPHPQDPVCHLSFFEAEAFARWAGARLPTEAEWERVALDSSVPLGSPAAQYADGPWLQPLAPRTPVADGSVWCWTRSNYGPYPGFRPVPGALGEYNGKFMNGQYVLRGGSCATPRGHVRASYRNFFAPQARWQFTGLRLARGAAASP